MAAAYSDAVEQTVPTIYSPQYGSPRVGWYGRLIAAAIALACGAMLGLASQLTPSPGGTGTHEQIGLNPCQFHLRTGIPCPSCGMTTSVAYFAQGRLLSSLYVQPMGAAVAAIAVMAVWAGGYIALTGRAAHRIGRFIPGTMILWGLIILAVAAWAWKIFIQLRGSDGGW